MIFVDSYMREYKIVYKLGSERRSMSVELEEVSKELILGAVLTQLENEGQESIPENIEILSVFRK